jgi:hypothetical protein
MLVLAVGEYAQVGMITNLLSGTEQLSDNKQSII